MRHLKNIVVLFLALNPVGVVYAAAASNGAREVTLSFREAVRRAKPAVVYIEARTRARRGFRMGYEQASGSGVIIDAAKGYVVTAAHVIEDATEVVVRLEDGRQFIAKNIWGDRESDVGVVQIEADNLPQAAFGNSDALEVGDWVLAIGSPFGRALENSVSVGIVSAKGRRTGILGAMGIEDFIQTDAVINRGNSGGPLVNIDGEVIGINSNIISSTGMNAGLGFAVPSKLAQATVEQLTTTGRVARGYMGVSLASLTDLESSVAENIPQSIRERGGAYLAMVIPGGPADEAGMRQGDIVLTFGDEEISSGSELVESIRAKLPGVVVRCTYWRDGEIHNASVKLAERPSSEQVIAESQGDPTTYAYRTLGIMASGWTGRIIEGGAVMRIRGMMVDFIRPGSPAAEAGLVRGDLIEEVNGQRVPDARRLDEALSAGDLDEGIRVKAISQAGERTVLIKR